MYSTRLQLTSYTPPSFTPPLEPYKLCAECARSNSRCKTRTTLQGLRVWGLGFGVWGLGFRVWGLGFGFMVEDLWFRV